jgi:hypothetical protein
LKTQCSGCSKKVFAGLEKIVHGNNFFK